MRRLAISVAAPAMAVGLALSSSVFAQGRTIEETLVVSDPTVAASGKWKVGGAGEYWWVRTKYSLVDDQGTKVGDATLTFKQPGWNIFAAYGNFTLQATRRSGEGDFTASAGSLQYGGPQKSEDEEYTLRWLFPTRSVSPYALLGYAKTTLTQVYDMTAPPAARWACSQTRHLETKEEFKGPLAGGGAIIPFSEKLGLRTDLRLHWNKVNQTENGTRTSCNNVETKGLSFDFTTTLYYNIIGGLNAQFGFKYQWLHGNDSRVDDWSRIGLFGMLGYSFRF